MMLKVKGSFLLLVENLLRPLLQPPIFFAHPFIALVHRFNGFSLLLGCCCWCSDFSHHLGVPAPLQLHAEIFDEFILGLQLLLELSVKVLFIEERLQSLLLLKKVLRSSSVKLKLLLFFEQDRLGLDKVVGVVLGFELVREVLQFLHALDHPLQRSNIRVRPVDHPLLCIHKHLCFALQHHKLVLDVLELEVKGLILVDEELALLSREPCLLN